MKKTLSLRSSRWRALAFVLPLTVAAAGFAACSGDDPTPAAPRPSSTATLEKCVSVLGTEREADCADAELVAMSRAQRELVREMAEATAGCREAPVDTALDCYRHANCDAFRNRATRLEEAGFPLPRPEGALASGPICGE